MLLSAAYKYISNGICVIATNDNKRAVLPWSKYQEKIITPQEAEQQFQHPKASGLAIICGKTSGNLEVIDIDVKYDITGRLYSDFIGGINPDLLARLRLIQTVSGGFHVYYRCETIQGNLKLANRHSTPEELSKDPGDKIKVLIETRGQGGYVIAPPTIGYRTVAGTSIPMITSEERSSLLDLARSFNQVIEPPVKAYTTQGYNPKEFGLSPFEDYNKRGDVIELLQRHGWKIARETSERIIFRRPGKDGPETSGDYLKAKQWFSVFTTSSLFEPQKAYLPYAVYALLECNGDFKKAARDLLDMGYGERREYFGAGIERDLYKKKLEGMDHPQLIQYITKKHKKTDEQAEELIEKLEKVWGKKISTFWDSDEKGRIYINRTRLINFLFNQGGFSLYYYDPNSTIFRIVRSVDGFIEEVSTEHIKKFLKNYIESLPDTFDGGITGEDLMELILKGSDSYFSKGILEFLNRGCFDFLKDTDKKAFFPFNNGIVTVCKDKICLVSYSDVNKVIWKSQVIDVDISIDQDLGAKDVEYAQFVNCISGNDENRYYYACTVIGYLLHKYKDYSKPYAVILAEENDNEEKGGGTGKGIFITALSKFLNTERVDGKNFKLDKNFAFQRVGLDTKLVAIEDCRKNVDFEGFYSIITEGITVEKKNKDELFIPYKDSPKIMFTTNYTISTVGVHAQRRQRVFEFSDFFNAKKTPLDHFGHNLFDQWDKDEWNRFYNFGFMCVQQYLASGVLTVQATDKIKRKHLRLKYGENFLEWWDEYIGNGHTEYKQASDIYHKFLNEYELDKKEYNQTRFGRALNEAASSVGMEVVKTKNSQSGKKELKIVKRKDN